MLNCLVVLESVVTRRGSDGRRRSADAELRPLAARLNTGGRDCPAGASFTAHIPTNRFLPTGCASSVPGMSIGAAADAMNRFFLSVPCPAPRGSGQFFGLASASCGVQHHCVADESLEGGVVNFVAFVQVDGTPDFPTALARYILPDFCSNDWRMGRDSNPRYLAVHTLSRRAQSTTLAPIQDEPETLERPAGSFN